MGGGLLDVNEMEVMVGAPVDQVIKCKFAGVPFEKEHGLTEKGLSKGNAVEASDELPFMIGLKGMGVSEFVEPGVCCDHVFRDPGSVLSLPLCFTALFDHFFECRIDPDFKSARPDDLPETFRHFELIRKQYHPRVR